MPRIITGSKLDKVLTVYRELTQCARRRDTVTYKKLSCRTGVGNAQSIGQVYLDPISRYCKNNGLPGLTSIVVLKGIGLPSTGFPGTPTEKRAMQQRVFAYEWTSVPEPSEGDLWS